MLKATATVNSSTSFFFTKNMFGEIGRGRVLGVVGDAQSMQW
jgi:hypothetical protein